MTARVLLLAGALQAALFLWFMVRGLYVLPVHDLLDILGGLLSGEGGAWFLRPHNDHILLLPKAWFAFDLAVLHGNLMAHAFLCAMLWGAAFAALAAILLQATAEDRALGLAAIGVLALFWFRAFTLEPFVIALGLGFVGMVSAAVLAIVLASGFEAGRRAKGGAGRVVAIVMLGLCAAGSLANGILALPVAGLVAWRRGRIGPGVGILLAGLGVIAGYAWLRASVAVGAVSFDPTAILTFLVVFFASPWFKVAPVAASAISVATLLALVLAAPMTVLAHRRLGRLAGGLAAFALGAACLIALGRAGAGAEGALAGRYGVFVAVAHAALVLAGVNMLGGLAPVARQAVAILALLGALPLIAEQVVIGQRYAARADQVADLKARLDRGEIDAAPDLGLSPGAARNVLGVLRERGYYGLR